VKDQSKSDFIFDLIEEFKIFNNSGYPNEITDETYHSFYKKYLELSSERDRALSLYLNLTENIFRCHMPRSKWVLGMSMQVVWYYDELVIGDPVLELLKSDEKSFDQKIYHLQMLLSFLKDCEESIKTGYLLLCGDDMISVRSNQFNHESQLLIENPHILDAFERASAFIKKPSPINNIPEDNLVQLETMYDSHFGTVRPMAMYFPPHVLDEKKFTKGINYNFTTPYSRTTKQEIINYGRHDILDPLVKEYKKDIAVVLETLANAQQLRLPVLFYRDVDSIVAHEYSSKNISRTYSAANTSIYECVLPYLDGVPPQRLAEIRYSLPEAFKDFRAFLFDLVKRVMNSTNNPAESKFKIESEINSKLRLLEVEMGNANRKLRSHGVVTPIALMAGSLSLYPLGIDYAHLITVLTGAGGFIKTVTTLSDVVGDKKKAALNPVYFLWKAQRELLLI
jgi:hypothetical protein